MSVVDYYLCSFAPAQAGQLWSELFLRAYHRPVYGARGIPGQPGACLLHAAWGDEWRAREAFEARPDVTPLGALWDPIPLAAVPALDALRVSLEAAPGVGSSSPRRAAPVAPTDTLLQALRKAVPDVPQ